MHVLKLTAGRSLTRRYQALLDHTGMTSTRIQPGESQENGAVGQRHCRTRRAIAEALVLRAATSSSMPTHTSCSFARRDLVQLAARASGIRPSCPEFGHRRWLPRLETNLVGL